MYPSVETKQVTERGACTSSNASAAEGGGANGQSYGSEVNQDTSYPGGANKWCLNIRADGNNGRLLDCTHGVYLVCCAGEGCDQGGDFHFIPGDLMDRYLGQLSADITVGLSSWLHQSKDHQK